jgi:hypothetical protein
VVTQAQLRLRRLRLARKYRANCTCPLTTGIFVRIVSEVAEEDRRAGKRAVTPYWRVPRDDGSLNEKFPGGTAAQAVRLRAEGLAIDRMKGHKPRVRNFRDFLAPVARSFAPAFCRSAPS